MLTLLTGGLWVITLSSSLIRSSSGLTMALVTVRPLQAPALAALALLLQAAALALLLQVLLPAAQALPAPAAVLQRLLAAVTVQLM